jgi:hypothetical protein
MSGSLKVRVMSKAEMMRREREAFSGVIEFVSLMSDADRDSFLGKIVRLDYAEMSFAEVMAALTLARATAIRIAAEVACE